MDNQGTLTITVQDKGDFVQICIADTGVGIKRDLQEKIFDPFFTTKPLGEGTGIGLDIVRQIVWRHNGMIKVESEPGKGASFIVQLPKERTKSSQA